MVLGRPVWLPGAPELPAVGQEPPVEGIPEALAAGQHAPEVHVPPARQAAGAGEWRAASIQGADTHTKPVGGCRLQGKRTCACSLPPHLLLCPLGHCRATRLGSRQLTRAVPLPGSAARPAPQAAEKGRAGSEAAAHLRVSSSDTVRLPQMQTLARQTRNALPSTRKPCTEDCGLSSLAMPCAALRHAARAAGYADSLAAFQQLQVPARCGVPCFARQAQVPHAAREAWCVVDSLQELPAAQDDATASETAQGAPCHPRSRAWPARGRRQGAHQGTRQQRQPRVAQLVPVQPVPQPGPGVEALASSRSLHMRRGLHRLPGSRLCPSRSRAVRSWLPLLPASSWAAAVTRPQTCTKWLHARGCTHERRQPAHPGSLQMLLQRATSQRQHVHGDLRAPQRPGLCDTLSAAVRSPCWQLAASKEHGCVVHARAVP